MAVIWTPKSQIKKTTSRAVRVLRWCAGPVALAGVLAWVTIGRGAASARTVAQPAQLSAQLPSGDALDAVPSYAVSALGKAATADLSPAARNAARRDAEKLVAERNGESARDRAAFAADGWETVKTAPPDAALVTLDPALLNGREKELRVQIASTVASPKEAGNLEVIARRATDAETRTIAVEALGRVGGSEAQRALFGLLKDAGLPESDPARKTIAPLLRPNDLGQPYAAELAAQLDNRNLSSVERQQLAFTLALVGLRDRTELPASALASLSPAARELLISARALATQSNTSAPR